MAFSVSPPERPKIKEVVEAMKPRTDYFFKGFSASSVKAVVSRVRQQWPNREYQTAKENGGARVWRLK